MIDRPRLEQPIAALIALVAWTGLGAQLVASIALTGSIGAAVWTMLRYFTVIVNLLVAILFTARASGLTGIATPVRVGGVAIAIGLVGIVFNLLLVGLVELSGGALLADRLNHVVTPILVTAYWLLVAPKGYLGWRDPPRWSLLPLIYFGYAMVRGPIEGIYAYPFLNVDRLGWGQVLTTAAIMAIAFLIAGHAMVWFDRRTAR